MIPMIAIRDAGKDVVDVLMCVFHSITTSLTVFYFFTILNLHGQRDTTTKHTLFKARSKILFFTTDNKYTIMKFLSSLLCNVTLLAVLGYNVVEAGHLFSNSIGNSLPAMNYFSMNQNQQQQQQQQQQELYPQFASLGSSNSNNLPRKYRRGRNTSSSSASTLLDVAIKKIESDVRGGSAAAGKVVRTMTARRMETLK
jgi:hypothetical protein